MVPTEAQKNQARSEPGPVATRFVGDLSLDEPPAPLPAEPAARIPGPDRIEVTQPYIPAIRDAQPEFAKRLNPNSSPAMSPTAPTATMPTPTAPTSPMAPVPPAPPVRPAAPVQPDTSAKPAAPPKRRSLARRVVRRIIGPDLLRKDPPKKRR